MIYIIYITRTIIAFVFFYSFVMKCRDFASFKNTIHNFQMLPPYLEHPIALAILTGELLIVLSALSGGSWLYLSYVLSIILLSIFIYIINNILKQNKQISCNCFGSDEKPVSAYDIWRNWILNIIASIGLISFHFYSGDTYIHFFEWSFLVIPAIIISIVLLNLNALLELIP